MEAEGVKFVTHTEVGVNYPAQTLLKEFDAVVLCTGATKPRDLPIEGRGLKVYCDEETIQARAARSDRAQAASSAARGGTGSLS